jgi:hypothetical protein
MMPTMRKRRKISSAVALREEEGGGRKDQGSDRNHRSRAEGWEAPQVVQGVPVGRAAVRRTAAGQRQPVGLELEPRPQGPAEPRLAPVHPRLVEPLVEQAPAARLLVQGPLRVLAEGRLRKPPPGREKREAERRRAPEKQAKRDQGVRKRQRRRQALERAVPGRPQRENCLPAAERLPRHANAAGEPGKPGQGVAPGGSFSFPRAQYPRRGYSQVAALLICVLQ